VNRVAISCLLLSLLASAASGQPSPTSAPQIVQISSSNLHLKAFLWKPAGAGPFPAVLFNHGSGEGDAAHTAGMQITEAAERLTPIFLKHGYAFLYLFRRGQGLSADQAPFMLKIYPRVGQTPDDGHNLLYLDIPRWEVDVFTFLDRHVKP
jgi:carboxymethylenebutenolidase